jgi:hypothetical protein
MHGLRDGGKPKPAADQDDDTNAAAGPLMDQAVSRWLVEYKVGKLCKASESIIFQVA